MTLAAISSQLHMGTEIGRFSKAVCTTRSVSIVVEGVG